MEIQELGLDLVKANISKQSTVEFKKRWFTFHDDSCGQRGHYIKQYRAYGHIIPDHYIVKRVLSFTNKGDEGKEDAVLGILNLKECKVIAITELAVEFENFKVFFKGNPYTQAVGFKY